MIITLLGVSLAISTYLLRTVYVLNKRVTALEEATFQSLKAIEDAMNKAASQISSTKIMLSSLNPDDYESQDDFMEALERELLEGQEEDSFTPTKKKGILQ